MIKKSASFKVNSITSNYKHFRPGSRRHRRKGQIRPTARARVAEAWRDQLGGSVDEERVRNFQRSAAAESRQRGGGPHTIHHGRPARPEAEANQKHPSRAPWLNFVGWIVVIRIMNRSSELFVLQVYQTYECITSCSSYLTDLRKLTFYKCITYLFELFFTFLFTYAVLMILFFFRV